MMIFDLDGTLADCEHRRHFVDRDKAAELGICYEEVEITFGGVQNGPWVLTHEPDRLWKPDWKAFFEACDQDIPIQPVIDIWNQQISLGMMDVHQIWSGRCESVREKTEKWLEKHLLCFNPKQLKMRPIGDNTPDDELKEKWLDEYLGSMWPKLPKITEQNMETVFHRDNPIEYIFDDRPKVVRMWRRRGIFVFDCNQTGKEF